MGRNEDLKTLTDSVKCLIVFENKASLLYGDVSSKTGRLPLIRGLFVQLSLDSQKHSEFLKGLVQSLPKTSWNPSDMPKPIAEALRSIDDFQIELSDVDRIQQEEISNLAFQLTSLENIMNQMYDTLIQYDAIELVSTELKERYNLKIDTLRTMLMEIVHEEECHKETLSIVQQLLEREEENKPNNAPIVRFQNPNAWTGPALTA